MKFRIRPYTIGIVALQVLRDGKTGAYEDHWQTLTTADYADRDTLHEMAQAHKDKVDRENAWRKVTTEEFEL